MEYSNPTSHMKHKKKEREKKQGQNNDCQKPQIGDTKKEWNTQDPRKPERQFGMQKKKKEKKNPL